METLISNGTMHSLRMESVLISEDDYPLTELPFSDFARLYCQDMEHRLRPSTYYIKKQLIQQKIIPYFGSFPLCAIRTSHIRSWQNILISSKKSDGKGFSPTYLKTINNQLNAIFNYAVKYYNLQDNPCQRTGSIGKSSAEEMQFWTREEFDQFIGCIPKKSIEHAAFMLLYYTGMRIGEMFALTAEDIDLDRGIVNVNKSYQRMGGKDIISAPKTPKSNRVIMIPRFLGKEIRSFIKKAGDGRIFNFRKEYLKTALVNGAEQSGVKRIRLHDLRHPYVKPTTKNFSTFFEISLSWAYYFIAALSL